MFMDEFSVVCGYFDNYLMNLSNDLHHCEEFNLVFNYVKFHFMVKEGIVLGQKISGKVIEVDRAKIEVIEKVTPPILVKGVRSFLVHAFYQRFIKNFSKISNYMCKLLKNEVKFMFDDNCLKAF